MTRESQEVETKAANKTKLKPGACMALTLVVSMLQVCLAAESLEEPTNELQLFFSATERADEPQLAGVQEQVAKEVVLASGESFVTGAGGLARVPDASAGAVQKNQHPLWLNGVVRTEESLLPMVNDLPCQTMPMGISKQVNKIQQLECAHIVSNVYSLKLRTSDYALLVYRHHRHVATLYPGQRL